VKRIQTNPDLCVFRKALDTLFCFTKAAFQLRTRRQNATIKIPACIWTHYNSQPIWAAL